MQFLKPAAKPVRQICFVSGSDLIASVGGQGKKVCLHDIVTGKRAGFVGGTGARPVHGMVITPDGRFALTVDEDMTFSISPLEPDEFFLLSFNPMDADPDSECWVETHVPPVWSWGPGPDATELLAFGRSEQYGLDVDPDAGVQICAVHFDLSPLLADERTVAVSFGRMSGDGVVAAARCHEDGTRDLLVNGARYYAAAEVLTCRLRPDLEATDIRVASLSGSHLQGSWHPQRDEVAVQLGNGLSIYRPEEHAWTLIDRAQSLTHITHRSESWREPFEYQQPCAGPLYLPDGSLLATTRGGLVRLYSTEPEVRTLAEWDWGVGEITALACNVDGSLLAAAGEQIVVWDRE